MRFMMMFMAGADYEAGAMPSEEALTAMGEVMAEMAEKGVLLAGDGLAPSSRAVRLELPRGERRIVDGPFTESKELVAGFCLIEVGSRAEAIDWGWRCLGADPGSRIEIRPILGDEEFGPEYTPEARALNAKTVAKAAANLSQSTKT